MSVRTWIRRGCLGGAVALAGFALASPTLAHADNAPPADPDAGRPSAWAGAAQATAFHYELNAQHGLGGLPLAQLIFGETGTGSTEFDAGGTAKANAGVFDPGSGVETGPSLFCNNLNVGVSLGPLCNPDYWPLTTRAEYPTRPDGGIGNPERVGELGSALSVTAGSAVAHADRRDVFSDASVGALTVPELVSGLVPSGSPGLAAADAFRARVAALHAVAPHAGALALAGSKPTVGAATSAATPVDRALVRIGAIESHTRQDFHGTQLVVHAESRLANVYLAAGLVHVGSIVATTDSTSAGRSPADTLSSIAVDGVSVLGLPAAITDQGVVITGGAGVGKPALDALNAGLAQALEALHLQLALVGASRTTPGNRPCAANGLAAPLGSPPAGSTRGDATALRLRTTLDLTTLPPLALPQPPPPFPFGVGSPADVYFVDLVLGQSCAVAYVGAGEPAPTVAAGGLTVDVPGVGSVGADLGTAPGADTSPAGTASDALGYPMASTATAPAARGAATGRRPGVEVAAGVLRPAGALGGVVASRVKLLYLAFALALAGLVLGARPFLPARLPRRR